MGKLYRFEYLVTGKGGKPITTWGTRFNSENVRSSRMNARIIGGELHIRITPTIERNILVNDMKEHLIRRARIFWLREEELPLDLFCALQAEGIIVDELLASFESE